MQLPSAILIGLEEISAGVAAVRELGEKGVAVHGIALHATPALYSRWLTRRYLLPKTEAGLVELLNTIAKREKAAFVLSVSEAASLVIRRLADTGQLQGLRPLLPSLDKLKLVNDKMATYTIAEEVGIPIPRTWLPRSESEAAAPPADLTYPCILKYSDPVGVTLLLKRHGMPLFKAKYCYSEEDLRRILLDHAPIGCYPLVQSFCPGRGLAHMFFMHEGKALLRFRHIRLLEWPPEGGVAAVCESLPIDDSDPLFAKSEELVRRIGWEGAAQVEYRYDPTTSSVALMEVNAGRFWATLSLAYYAGAHFVWLTYAVLGLNQPVTLKPYKSGLQCRFIAFEVFRLLRILFQPDKVQNRDLRFNRPLEIAGFLMGYLKPQTRYYLFSWKDPLPALVHLPLKIGREIHTKLARTMCVIQAKCLGREVN
jgi:predicted ATP-grasp superfamily ATP-dependent carboligase